MLAAPAFGGGGGGGVVIAVNPSPIQESTLRNIGFICMSLVYFLKRKKQNKIPSTFSITTHIQVLIHLIKTFEVTGKRAERKWKIV